MVQIVHVETAKVQIGSFLLLLVNMWYKSVDFRAHVSLKQMSTAHMCPVGQVYLAPTLVSIVH